MSNPDSASSNEKEENYPDYMENRLTPVVRRDNGKPLGVSIFLSASDLEKLGIELDGKQTLEYNVTGGKIAVIDDTDQHSESSN